MDPRYAAKSKRPDPDTLPTRARMSEGQPIRRNPSTDQKKQRRQIRRSAHMDDAVQRSVNHFLGVEEGQDWFEESGSNEDAAQSGYAQSRLPDADMDHSDNEPSWPWELPKKVQDNGRTGPMQDVAPRGSGMGSTSSRTAGSTKHLHCGSCGNDFVTRKDYGISCPTCGAESSVTQAKNSSLHVAIRTADGKEVGEGDRVFDYYDGHWGTIRGIDDAGWFDHDRDGGGKGYLNGERVAVEVPAGAPFHEKWKAGKEGALHTAADDETWDTGEVELWFDNDQGMYSATESETDPAAFREIWESANPNTTVDPDNVDWDAVATWRHVAVRKGASMQREANPFFPHRQKEESGGPGPSKQQHDQDEADAEDLYKGFKGSHREAALLQAIANAPTYEEQQHLARQLEAHRAQVQAERQADRELFFSSQIVEARMTPVRTHELHTAATEWLATADTSVDQAAMDRAMGTEANLWFSSTSPELRADPEEFAIQAHGMADRIASQYAESAPAALDSFLSQTEHLYRATGGKIGSLTKRASVEREAFLRFEGTLSALLPYTGKICAVEYETLDFGEGPQTGKFVGRYTANVDRSGKVTFETIAANGARADLFVYPQEIVRIAASDDYDVDRELSNDIRRDNGHGPGGMDDATSPWGPNEVDYDPTPWNERMKTEGDGEGKPSGLGDEDHNASRRTADTDNGVEHPPYPQYYPAVPPETFDISVFDEMETPGENNTSSDRAPAMQEMEGPSRAVEGSRLPPTVATDASGFVLPHPSDCPGGCGGVGLVEAASPDGPMVAVACPLTISQVQDANDAHPLQTGFSQAQPFAAARTAAGDPNAFSPDFLRHHSPQDWPTDSLGTPTKEQEHELDRRRRIEEASGDSNHQHNHRPEWYDKHGGLVTAVDEKDDAQQSGHADTGLPTKDVGNTTDKVAWPWEVDDNGGGSVGADDARGTGAADVAGVPTPGGPSGYPQPKRAEGSGAWVGPTEDASGGQSWVDQQKTRADYFQKNPGASQKDFHNFVNKPAGGGAQSTAGLHTANFSSCATIGDVVAVIEEQISRIQHTAASMTRQHFEHIADSISSAPVDAETRVKLANHFADRLGSTNPQFRRETFVTRASSDPSKRAVVAAVPPPSDPQAVNPAAGDAAAPQGQMPAQQPPQQAQQVDPSQVVPGAKIMVFDLQGQQWAGTVVSSDGTNVTYTVDGDTENPEGYTLPITTAVASVTPGGAAADPNAQAAPADPNAAPPADPAAGAAPPPADGTEKPKDDGDKDDEKKKDNKPPWLDDKKKQSAFKAVVQSHLQGATR